MLDNKLEIQIEKKMREIPIFKNLKDIPNLSKFYNNNYFIWFGKKANYKLNRVCFSKFLENKF